MVKYKCIYKGYTFSKEMYYLCRREREENVGTYINESDKVEKGMYLPETNNLEI